MWSILMIKRSIFLFILLSICFSFVWAENEKSYVSKQEKFILQEVIGGLGVPWGMAFLSTNDIIFTEREGAIGLLNLTNKDRFCE